MRCKINIKPENKDKYAKYLYEGLDGQEGEIVKYFDDWGDKMVRIRPDKVVSDFWGFNSDSWAICADDVTLLKTRRG